MGKISMFKLKDVGIGGIERRLSTVLQPWNKSLKLTTIPHIFYLSLSHTL